MEENLTDLFQNIFNNSNLDNKNEQIIYDNVLFLAYIGDSLYEVITRDYLIKKYHNKYKILQINDINKNLVCANAQSQIIQFLINNNVLNDEEISIFKSGRNAHTNSKSKNSKIIDYRKATGLEVLIGYLFYNNKIERIIYLCNMGIEYLLKHIINENYY